MEDLSLFYLTLIFIPIIISVILFCLYLVNNKKSRLFLVSWNLTLVVFMVALLFAGVETYYRFFLDTTDSYGLTMINKRWYLRHFQTNNLKIRDDRDYRLARDPSKKHRVTFIGDSFTAGHGIKDVKDRFANIIREAHPDWEVQLLADIGFETTTEIDFTKSMVAQGYQLDYVVLCYCLNDISNLMPEKDTVYNRIYDEYSKRAGFLDTSSFFINTWYYRLKGNKDPALANYFSFVKNAYSGPQWEQQKRNLTILSELVKLSGGKLLVVTFPFFNAIKEEGYEYASVHAELNSFWSSIGVPSLDLFPSYRSFKPADLVVNKYDAHPNELAHSLAAKEIDEFIAKQIGN